MRIFLKAILTSISAFILVFLALVGKAIAAPAWPNAPEVKAKSVYIMETSSDTVLYEKEASNKMYPASTTKLMTCLLAVENSSMDEMVTFSENAVYLMEGAVTIDSQVGEEMRLEDALYGLMLPSGNDCAVAIAEHIAGSVEAFADMMNARAKEVGATSTHFVNPNGLPDENHYTTAHDMALIAKEAFKNSVVAKIVSTTSYTAAPTNMSNERTFKNINMLIQPNSDYYDERVIGGKTGYIDEGGRCLVTYAKQDNMSIVIVQLNGGTAMIFDDAKALVNFSFDNFTMTNLAKEESRFSFASEKSKVVVDSTAQAVLPKNASLSDVDSTIILAKDMDDASRQAALENNTYSDTAKLYAVINYTMGDRFLGSVNVYLEPKLKIAKASFITLNYINIVFVIIFAILILVISSLICASKKRRPQSRKQIKE